MSSQDAKEVILKDLTQVELDTTSTSALFMQSYADGGSLDNIVEIAKIKSCLN